MSPRKSLYFNIGSHGADVQTYRRMDCYITLSSVTAVVVVSDVMY